MAKYNTYEGPEVCYYEPEPPKIETICVMVPALTAIYRIIIFEYDKTDYVIG